MVLIVMIIDIVNVMTLGVIWGVIGDQQLLTTADDNTQLKRHVLFMIRENTETNQVPFHYPNATIHALAILCVYNNALWPRNGKGL